LPIPVKPQLLNFFRFYSTEIEFYRHQTLRYTKKCVCGRGCARNLLGSLQRSQGPEL